MNENKKKETYKNVELNRNTYYQVKIIVSRIVT